MVVIVFAVVAVVFGVGLAVVGLVVGGVVVVVVIVGQRNQTLKFGQ